MIKLMFYSGPRKIKSSKNYLVWPKRRLKK